MSIGGCNMRENKTKPSIDGLILQTLPWGANFTEWHALMYDVEMISDISERQNDIVPIQTIWNLCKNDGEMMKTDGS